MGVIIIDIVHLGLWLIIGLLLCCLTYGLWTAYRNNKPWNSIGNVAMAGIILLSIGYDLKMEIFAMLGLGVFLGLVAIFLSNLYHKNLRIDDAFFFLITAALLIANSSQIHLIVTY
ncbi:hypothetical protein [Methanobacterium sp.]|jgi:hypothetical protein|uniref:hypothetical protein n=1 Tax=Methanobacterium sp. TaxID=2164 RepID=UPI00315891F1